MTLADVYIFPWSIWNRPKFSLGSGFHSTEKHSKPTNQPMCLPLYSNLEKLIDSNLAEISNYYWVFANFSGWFVSHMLSFPKKQPIYCKALDSSVFPLSCTALVCWFGYCASCWRELLGCWKLSCDIIH